MNTGTRRNAARRAGLPGCCAATLVLALNSPCLAWQQLGGDGARVVLDNAAYNQELLRRHMNLTRNQLIALAEQEYRRLDAELASLAAEIDPKKTWRQIVTAFEQTSHPQTLADIIPAYQAELQRAKAFVLKKDLVSLPQARELPVLPTPLQWISSFPYALYRWHEDVLFVTVVTLSGDQTEAVLSHNDGLIAVAAVHEAYPGHRTQNLIHSNDGIQGYDETFIEGWGLYSEELMLREGYYDAGPSHRKLFALRMLLWRAARALLDARMHRGDITPHDAVDFLVQKIGLTEARARAEVQVRYVGAPASVATYLVGKREIEALRRQVKAAEGDRFTLKNFHDRLLSQGGVAIETIAREAFHMEFDAHGIQEHDAAGRGKLAATGPATVHMWLVYAVAASGLIGVVMLLRARRRSIPASSLR